MKLAVIGLGLIGGSMALDLKECGFVSVVYGVDQNPDHCKEALELKIVDKICSLAEAYKLADLILISTPVGVMLKILPEILDNVTENQTVFDVGSTKGIIGEIIENHSNRKNFVATHPMAGTEFSGPKAAHLGLFKNKATVICDADLSHAEHIKKVTDMYNALEMRVV
ncbi:MAG: prephenate dehydrogenase/arogenate dehydrogenase family protein, partial [Bdellovibrionales bacterium]|nr:prephenate dehydrogenase/arogenate dehydrogenase family protein [Bdellovibrionales bacterium]